MISSVSVLLRGGVMVSYPPYPVRWRARLHKTVHRLQTIRTFTNNEVSETSLFSTFCESTRHDTLGRCSPDWSSTACSVRYERVPKGSAPVNKKHACILLLWCI